jgi:hypothetical protein
MTPAFRSSSSTVNGSGITDATPALVAPAGTTTESATESRSPFANLRHDLFIGLGAFAVLIGVIAFSIFGQPRGVAEASPNSEGPSTLTARVTDGAVRATPAVAAPDPAQAAAELAAKAWIDGVNEAARIDAFLNGVEGVAQILAAQAPRPAAAIRSGGNTGRSAPATSDGSVWDRLAQCESGGNWAINTGNGFSGGLQFLRSTWLGVGGGEYASDAHLATREQQIDIATRVLASQGWRAWPGCSSMLGLR